ncbi:MAG TPA: glycoside hydrolase family 130 protein [Phycisphaerae bacterium]|nr:glycoside hydrolase family 130 protein [Phycisphaerae bacterium]
MLKRLDANPLLTPEDLKPTREDLRVLCTLNPGAVRFGDQTLLLVRVGERPLEENGSVAYLRYDAEAGNVKVDRIATDDPALEIRDARGYFLNGKMLLTSMSHLRVARSSDGVTFRFDEEPALFPATPYEAYGCEDPRITFIDGRYLITYTAVSDRGVTVALAATEDFVHFERLGVIFPPYQKDVCIFPAKVRGLYVCRHRPYASEFNPASIWTAYSPDLLSWGRHERTLAPTPGSWESERVGCGAPPVRTDAGWLEIYHGADDTGRYHLAAMLSDLDHPERILTRSRRPVLEPQADYELKGVYGNCVFSNGLVVDDDGTMTVYYGAADRICAAAVTTVDEMVQAARNER